MSSDAFDDLLDDDFLASLSTDIDVNSVRAYFNKTEEPPEPTICPPEPIAAQTDVTARPTQSDHYLDIIGHSQRWTIGKIIAESDKATVREAVGQDGRVAAVKILPLSHRDNDNVDQEAAIGGLLSTHPYILDVYDYVKSEEAGYIFMERADGDLYEIVEKAESGLDEETARSWFRTLVAAVGHCHQNFYSHRDLKPENCLIANGTLKLSDFGSAISMTVKDPPSACGTVQYAAPERFLDLVATPDANETESSDNLCAVDLWSLGIILYVLVKQQFPFMEPSMRCPSFRRFINGHDELLLEGMSDSLKQLIRGILKFKPADRLSLDLICNHPWLKQHSGAAAAPGDQLSLVPELPCGREAASIGIPSYLSTSNDMLHSSRTISAH